MTKTMIMTSIFIAYVSLISLVSISQCDQFTEASSYTGFTTDLIHRDSPQSPSYDPSVSHYKHLIKALKRSYNRVQRFTAKRSNTLPESAISFAGGEYLMKFSIGTPPTPTLAIADTGSDVIWTQCQPCLKCFNQSLPSFKPKDSSTYIKIPCTSPKCKSFKETFCSKTRQNCLYNEMYYDSSYSYGELATDTFVFPSSKSGKTVSFSNILFGCGFKNTGLFSGTESGIVGLGGGNGSLVRQLGQGKFSYCLTPISDHSNTSKLNFGASAKVAGKGVVSTPLLNKKPETYYYLTLEGISVENQRFEYYDTNSTSYKDGNMIIDSGTTLTLFPPDLYAKVEKALTSLIKLKRVKDPEGVLSLCYFAKEDDEIRVPEITVHFKGGDVKWKRDNIFVRTSNVSVCFASQGADDIGVYGNLAQINFLVGYDLVKRTVSFKPTYCGKS